MTGCLCVQREVSFARLKATETLQQDERPRSLPPPSLPRSLHCFYPFLSTSERCADPVAVSSYLRRRASARGRGQMCASTNSLPRPSPPELHVASEFPLMHLVSRQFPSAAPPSLPFFHSLRPQSGPRPISCLRPALVSSASSRLLSHQLTSSTSRNLPCIPPLCIYRLAYAAPSGQTAT